MHVWGALYTSKLVLAAQHMASLSGQMPSPSQESDQWKVPVKEVHFAAHL